MFFLLFFALPFDQIVFGLKFFGQSFSFELVVKGRKVSFLHVVGGCLGLGFDLLQLLTA